MQENIKKLVEGFCTDELAIIRPALVDVLAKRDEDILIITIREAVAAGQLVAGSQTAIAASNIILDAEPKRSLLAKFARKLHDKTMTKYYLAWIDNVLTRNIHLEPEEFAEQWSALEDVVLIRAELAKVPAC